ncbi:6-phosphogluconolactonase [Calidifontibacter sp. DB0510]|uniref:6-phosphogluconolactonase n=1 Tax=Metallococcus carri TaxID=1656884 RepID=A0A967AXP5_9MICO|nr:6-phosphogluconolactonase [Metallococcus carri]NHN54906.1 6-phosphogluconolactonase [Metallococcus carri]NOP37252.1 6-phosphogluconolactonase [Calidifontibacter sp. DB2511S]
MKDHDLQIRKDKATLAADIVDALVARIDEALQQRGEAHVVLTGGSMGEAVMQAWSARPADDADRSAVHLWWGDERWVPAGDAERNDQQAVDAGLKRLGIPDDNIHRMPAAGGSYGDDVERAAAAYASELAEFDEADTNGLEEDPAVPTFDVLMLGVGPDGHIASLFPQHKAQNCTTTTTVAVHDSPKPPPTRISLTYPAIERAREIWFTVAGADKADAVERALTTDDPWNTPASAVEGLRATVWWLDTAAAAKVPSNDAS